MLQANKSNSLNDALTPAEAPAVGSTETLSAEAIVATIINNTIGGVLDSEGVPTNNDGSCLVNGTTVVASDAACIQDSTLGVNNSIHVTDTVVQLKSRIDLNSAASDNSGVDLFSPPFGASSTAAKLTYSNVSGTHLESAKSDSDTIVAQNQVNYATDNCTLMSDNMSEDVVSPPLLERTLLNEQKRSDGTNLESTIRTPKRPKIISLDNCASNKSATESECYSNSLAQEPMASLSSSLHCDNTLLKKLSSVIPFPIKIWSRSSSDSLILTSFIDVVDLTSHPCCGYKYILRMVDPVHRYGHSVAMKSTSKDDINYSLRRLLTVVRIQPSTLYFDDGLMFLQDLSKDYPSIKFLCQKHSEAMNNERELFMVQLNKWIDSEKNWVCGVSVIQAVTNTLPIKPV